MPEAKAATLGLGSSVARLPAAADHSGLDQRASESSAVAQHESAPNVPFSYEGYFELGLPWGLRQ